MPADRPLLPRTPAPSIAAARRELERLHPFFWGMAAFFFWWTIVSAADDLAALTANETLAGAVWLAGTTTSFGVAGLLVAGAVRRMRWLASPEHAAVRRLIARSRRVPTDPRWGRVVDLLDSLPAEHPAHDVAHELGWRLQDAMLFEYDARATVARDQALRGDGPELARRETLESERRYRRAVADDLFTSLRDLQLWVPSGADASDVLAAARAALARADADREVERIGRRPMRRALGPRSG